MFLNYLQEKKRKKAGPGSSRLENQKVCKCAQEDYKAELGYPLKKSYGNHCKLTRRRRSNSIDITVTTL